MHLKFKYNKQLLESFSDEELNKIKTHIETIQTNRLQLQVKHKVEQSIKECGFYLDLNGELDTSRRKVEQMFPEYHCGHIPFVYEYFTYEKDQSYRGCGGDFDKTIGSLTTHDIYTIYTLFEEKGMVPTHLEGTNVQTIEKFNYDLEELEDFGDWDSPAEGKIRIDIPILYKKVQPFPPPGLYYFFNFDSDYDYEVIDVYDDQFTWSHDTNPVTPETWDTDSEYKIYVPFDFF